MVENYVLAKKIVSKKLDSNHTMYPFMVCSLYGLLCKYPGHEEMITSLFSTTDIIFEKGPVEEILRRHQIDMDFADPIPDDPESSISTLGVSNQGHSFLLDHGEVVYEKNKPFVICSTSYTNMTRLLNTFCHEMGHLIKGEENGFHHTMVNDQPTFIIRTGMTYIIYMYNKDFTEVELSNSFGVLDEAINCIQTTDVMKEILALDTFVEDDSIHSFIQSLDKEDMIKDHGYEDIVLLLRLFWAQDSFKDSIETHIVHGGIDFIVSDFDSMMGNGSFQKMSEILEELYEMGEEYDEDRFNFLIDSYKEMSEQYKSQIKARKKDI